MKQTITAQNPPKIENIDLIFGNVIAIVVVTTRHIEVMIKFLYKE